MNLFELTFDELADRLKSGYGKGAFHAAALFREVIKNGNRQWALSDEFQHSPRLARSLSEVVKIPEFPVVGGREEEGVLKFISKLSDGFEIESVVIPMSGYKTLCVSSQAGCRMGCRFCETARMGLVRNLSVGEIVGQVYTARHVLGHGIRNVVFMGMGEPFDNFDHVVRAVRVLNDQRGFDIALRRMTVSTAGLADGIRKLAKLQLHQLNLAVSLNAPDDTIRSRLMPVNKNVPMDDLRGALLEYQAESGREIFVEYVLIKNVNDARKDAERVAAYLDKLNVRLNVIPYNPGRGSVWESPSDKEVHVFSGWLEASGIFVRKRWSRGRTLMAGCGQLGNRGQVSEAH